ncbi:MAG: site-2 protease family protein [candidate division KSB1 bacterium]|nr:site-2 protease family protein [candidate division KSB1 bacterium]
MERLATYAILAPPILLALTLHEYAHARVADSLGDPTPRLSGRLTLNPLAHLDLVGTILLFVARIGWAKPVPVNPYYFRDPRAGMLYVSLAGPAANLLTALVFGALCRFWGLRSLVPLHGGALGILEMMLVLAVYINLVLAAFNLIPVPPLDGSKILAGILGGNIGRLYGELGRYGSLFLLAVIAVEMLTGVPILWAAIGPFVRFFSTLFVGSPLT